MIETHIASAPAPWSVDELAAVLQCDRSNGRRKVIRLAERLETQLQALAALDGIDRPDRQTASLLGAVELIAQLHADDPERLKRWIRAIAEAIRIAH
jgi:hypothetical protein